MIRSTGSKSKNSSKGSVELRKLYQQAISDKEKEFGWLGPGSYTTEHLIREVGNGRLYRPLARSFGLV